VAGDVWGMLTVTSATAALPVGTEDRLQQFAELVGAALANVQARADVQALAEEQAALRRLAELAAREATVPEVLDALAHEASWLAGVDFGMVLRFEPDGSTQIEALAGAPENFRVGMRASAAGDGSAWRVWRTGRAGRVDDLGSMSGLWPRMAHEFGFTSSAAAPMRIDESLWGALVVVARHGPLPRGLEDHLSSFSELAGTVIAAAQDKAKLRASRARVVATADETRRRIQRDVHDGAQQRLVHTIVTLKLARDAITGGRDASQLVEEALRNAERANRDLRDVIRGILPAALARGGLAAALETLVEDMALPVQLDVPPSRLPPTLETTGYFVVAEALTNVVKHANARHAVVEVRLERETLVIQVRDDGDGGADPTLGTGLTGLVDRVEAGDGRLTLSSPVGRGTMIHVELPLEAASASSSGYPDEPGGSAG
jgi:signal transduction histidine kinase